MTNEQEGDGDRREGQERPDEDNTLVAGLAATAPVANLPQVQNNFQEAENLQTQVEQPET